MAETRMTNLDGSELGEGEGSTSPDFPSPHAPAQDPEWEQQAKPDLSIEERTMGLPADKLRQIMRDMLQARRFEEKTAEAYALGRIGGFCHLYIGQEAVAIGAIHALNEGDYTMTAYRDHVHALQMGIEPSAIM